MPTWHQLLYFNSWLSWEMQEMKACWQASCTLYSYETNLQGFTRAVRTTVTKCTTLSLRTLDDWWESISKGTNAPGPQGKQNLWKYQFSWLTTQSYTVIYSKKKLQVWTDLRDRQNNIIYMLISVPWTVNHQVSRLF